MSNFAVFVPYQYPAGTMVPFACTRVAGASAGGVLTGAFQKKTSLRLPPGKRMI